MRDGGINDAMSILLLELRPGVDATCALCVPASALLKALLLVVLDTLTVDRLDPDINEVELACILFHLPDLTAFVLLGPPSSSSSLVVECNDSSVHDTHCFDSPKDRGRLFFFSP